MSGRDDLTLARRFLLWFMRFPPFSPYVATSFTADMTAALAYLAELNGTATEGASRVTLQHLVTAAVARTYRQFPDANATVRGSRIVRHPHVGVVMPVNLLAHDKAKQGETSVVLVEEAETLSLLEIADETTARVRDERGGNSQNPLFRTLMPVASMLPTFALEGVFNAVDRFVRLPVMGDMVHRVFPLTVVVSNVGAAVPLPQGALTRAAAFSPPNRLLGIPTLFGVFPMQDEVVAVDGRAEVRPVLPITYIFDHRLFDGVRAGHILTDIMETLLDPASVLGADGTTIN